MQTDNNDRKSKGLSKMLYIDDDLEMPALVKAALKKLVTLTDIKYPLFREDGVKDSGQVSSRPYPSRCYDARNGWI